MHISTPARGVHPRDNRGETRGNLVFYPCILPVNPGEITNFAIIGRWGEGKQCRINHMAEAAYATGPALLGAPRFSLLAFSEFFVPCFSAGPKQCASARPQRTQVPQKTRGPKKSARPKCFLFVPCFSAGPQGAQGPRKTL
jgi:hypothetical protein